MIEMRDIPYSDTDWIEALRKTTGRGYRKTKNGCYETFTSVRSKTISLGTYDTIIEASKTVFDYRAKRLIEGVEAYSLNIDDSVVFMDRYLAFPNGLIFNLYGERMIGAVNRHGYVHGIFNGRNINIHRIIATFFCDRPPGCDYVNHIDGNKQNNRADNLEWVTRSENSRHSYRLGLQTSTGTGSVYSDEERQYIRDHCFDYYKDVASHLGRNPETVRKYMAKYRKEFNND